MRRPRYLLARVVWSVAPWSKASGSTALILLVLCNLATAGTDELGDAGSASNWAAYGRTYDDNHYSPLAQINRSNVSQLGLLWSVDLPTIISTHAAPLAVDGTLYFAMGLSVVNARDARTGKLLWSFDPDVAAVGGEKLRPAWGIRGLAYWQHNIYVGTQDGRLIALDASSGKQVWSVQTTEGAHDGRYITGAPRIFNGKVIIGHGGADFASVRGYVTAYDAATGRRLWRFYTVPGDPSKGFENKAMEMAAKTWHGEWWKYGGGGTVWNAITYDPELNRIYLGTGNGAPWNRNIRSPGGGDNLFLCSIVALDADTGEYIWHYQTTPGESWDFNSAMDIELATLQIQGRSRRVILHAPKNGFFYVIDRDLGKLISAEPFTKVTWASRIDSKTGYPVENPDARFPSGQTLIQPGGSGAHNWMPMAYSPQTHLVYIPTTALPGFYSTAGVDQTNWKRLDHVALETGFAPYAAIAPPPPLPQPLGSLLAWDPVTQRRVWSVPMRNAFNGGVLATAGGLIFQGNNDGHFVAYDALSGKVLRDVDAQDGIIGQPVSYEVGGRQFITVVTGISAIASSAGPSVAVVRWDYGTQRRRILTFAIGGAAKLPAPVPRAVQKVVEDPSFIVDPAFAERGASIYATHCLACHGVAAVAGGAAPDLRKSAVPLNADAFATIVHAGALRNRAMPRFAELSDAELLALRHFLRAAARAAPSTEK